MSFRVSGKNLDLGDALRDRINDRIAETVGKYFDGGYSGHATLAKDGFGFRTECADPSRFQGHSARRRHRARCLCQRRSGGIADRKAAAPLSSPAQGSPRRAQRRSIDRCGKLHHRRARRRGGNRGRCVHSRHHRGIDHGLEAALGQRCGDGTRHDRRAGCCLSSCRRTAESTSFTAAPTGISAGSIRRQLTGADAH